MPLAVALHGSLLDPRNPTAVAPEAFVWMPEYLSRTTAINTARRIFNHILEKAGLDDPDKKLTPHSLRRYALQARLRGSHGKVNIHILAQNAGSSVDQRERFYLKRMTPTKETIENLQFRPCSAHPQDLSRKGYDLSLQDLDHIEYDDDQGCPSPKTSLAVL